MIKVKSRSDLYPAKVTALKVVETKPEPTPSVTDVVNEALEELAIRSTAMIGMIGRLVEAQEQANNQPALPVERKPIRLEASVVRDNKDRMSHLVITPVYE